MSAEKTSSDSSNSQDMVPKMGEKRKLESLHEVVKVSKIGMSTATSMSNKYIEHIEATSVRVKAEVIENQTLVNFFVMIFGARKFDYPDIPADAVKTMKEMVAETFFPKIYKEYKKDCHLKSIAKGRICGSMQDFVNHLKDGEVPNYKIIDLIVDRIKLMWRTIMYNPDILRLFPIGREGEDVVISQEALKSLVEQVVPFANNNMRTKRTKALSLPVLNDPEPIQARLTSQEEKTPELLQAQKDYYKELLKYFKLAKNSVDQLDSKIEELMQQTQEEFLEAHYKIKADESNQLSLNFPKCKDLRKLLQLARSAFFVEEPPGTFITTNNCSLPPFFILEGQVKRIDDVKEGQKYLTLEDDVLVGLEITNNFLLSCLSEVNRLKDSCLYVPHGTTSRSRAIATCFVINKDLRTLFHSTTAQFFLSKNLMGHSQYKVMILKKKRKEAPKTTNTKRDSKCYYSRMLYCCLPATA